jgi:hypothetical protein
LHEKEIREKKKQQEKERKL